MVWVQRREISLEHACFHDFEVNLRLKALVEGFFFSIGANRRLSEDIIFHNFGS